MKRREAAYKFTAKKKEEFLKLLGAGARRGAAAEAVGVTRQTVRLHMANDAEFAAAVDQAEMDANELVEDALFQAAQSGNVVAAQVWLYNRDPDRWQDRRNVRTELTGRAGGPIEVTGAHEELIARLAALAARPGAGGAGP